MENKTLLEVREVTVNYKKVKAIKDKVKSSQDIKKVFWKIVKNNTQEHMCAFYLDASHCVIHCSNLFTGTANACTFHPREVYQIAVMCGACAVIVAHNHPSGDIQESSSDKQATKQLKESGEILGIPLLDHIIVSENDHNSARESNWF